MPMQTIELEAIVDGNGNIHLPEQCKPLYGQQIRLVLSPNKVVSKDELTDFFSQFNSDLTKFHFNREEANESSEIQDSLLDIIGISEGNEKDSSYEYDPR